MALKMLTEVDYLLAAVMLTKVDWMPVEWVVWPVEWMWPFDYESLPVDRYDVLSRIAKVEWLPLDSFS